MQSVLHTGPSLKFKVAYDDGTEKTIGYASGLQYTVQNGQKPLFVVDSVFPADIAQGASPSMVTGTVMLYLPKGMTPESAGMVPYRQTPQGDMYMPLSRFMHFRLYDRVGSRLIFSADFCKVSSYSVRVQTKGWAMVSLQFEGIFLTPGNNP